MKTVIHDQINFDEIEKKTSKEFVNAIKQEVNRYKDKHNVDVNNIAIETTKYEVIITINYANAVFSFFTYRDYTSCFETKTIYAVEYLIIKEMLEGGKV